MQRAFSLIISHYRKSPITHLRLKTLIAAVLESAEALTLMRESADFKSLVVLISLRPDTFYNTTVLDQWCHLSPEKIWATVFLGGYPQDIDFINRVIAALDDDILALISYGGLYLSYLRDVLIWTVPRNHQTCRFPWDGKDPQAHYQRFLDYLVCESHRIIASKADMDEGRGVLRRRLASKFHYSYYTEPIAPFFPRSTSAIMYYHKLKVIVEAIYRDLKRPAMPIFL